MDGETISGSPEVGIVNGHERYACNHCGNLYNRRWNLLRHIKEQHDITAELHKCPIDGCDFNSKRQSTVKRHVIDKHRESNIFPAPVPRNKESPPGRSTMMNLYRQQVLRARSFCINADLLHANDNNSQVLFGDQPPKKTSKIDCSGLDSPEPEEEHVNDYLDQTPCIPSPMERCQSQAKIDKTTCEHRDRILSTVDELSSLTGYRIAILAIDDKGAQDGVSGYQAESHKDVPQFMETFSNMLTDHKICTLNKDNATQENDQSGLLSRCVVNTCDGASESSEDIAWNDSEKFKLDSNVAWIQGPSKNWLAVPVLAVSKERPTGLFYKTESMACHNDWSQICFQHVEQYPQDCSPDTDRASGASEVSVTSTSMQQQLFKELTREFEPLFQA